MNKPQWFDYLMVGLCVLLLSILAFVTLALLYVVPVVIMFVVGIPLLAFGVGYLVLQVPTFRRLFWFD
jgi:hypothetical protein